MFFHDKRLQYNAEPEHPDPLYAKKLQEILGGQFGEITVMMQYMFQGFNCRGPAKYRDMILDIATEEIAHVEMIATMISKLLAEAPVEDQQQVARQRSLLSAITAAASPRDVAYAAGLNPQHMIVSGLGATPTDSVGYPWNSRYTIASGNLLADFRANVNAESQGRLQVCRLYEMTEDKGVRDMLSFLIARDTMHQNQWLAAIAELEAEGLDATPVPKAFPQDLEKREVAYQFWNCSNGSDGTASSQGRWAHGRAPDGKGEFEYVANPQPMGPVADLGPANPHVYSTLQQPMPATA